MVETSASKHFQNLNEVLITKSIKDNINLYSICSFIKVNLLAKLAGLGKIVLFEIIKMPLTCNKS